MTLNDGIDTSVSYFFKMTLTNSAPKFMTKLPSKVNVQLNKEFGLQLPLIFDMENNPVYFENLELPDFVILDHERKIFFIRPKNPE